MKHFVKIVNGFQLLNIVTKRSIVDIWQGSDYASVKKPEKQEKINRKD